jgi:hypothetical protein
MFLDGVFLFAMASVSVGIGRYKLLPLMFLDGVSLFAMASVSVGIGRYKLLSLMFLDGVSLFAMASVSVGIGRYKLILAHIWQLLTRQNLHAVQRADARILN